MSRCLLHINKLDAFKSWLDKKGMEHRPGRGDYEMLQVRWRNLWYCVFRRAELKEHYTVDGRLEPTVRKFIAETRKK